MKRLLLALALLVPLAASADEGMWMIHALNQALEKKMQERGLQLSAGEIYNADAPGPRSPTPSFRWAFTAPPA